MYKFESEMASVEVCDDRITDIMKGLVHLQKNIHMGQMEMVDPPV